MRVPRHTHRARSRRAGLTLVELLVVMAILTVAIGAMTDTVVSVTQLGPVNQETARALDAARGVAETLGGVPFDEVVARYNDDPDDDPDGAGTAPGRHFQVRWLDARPDDPDGFVGEVILPLVGGELREDLVDDDLGTPCDLNGDGAVDGADHAGDYALLPVVVRLQWQGTTGPRALSFPTTLVRP